MFIKYPSIEQFRHIVKYVQRYSATGSCTSINYQGTVKLHGTNAAIVLTGEGDVYAQSRNNIITPEADNAGFAKFVEARKDLIKEAFCYWGRTVVIYGEWCGKGIQAGVALNELEKMFVIFSVRFIKLDGTKSREMIQELISAQELKDNNIYNITEFPTFNATINFEKPDEIVPLLTEYTEEVERECPVAKFFSVSGIGEGIVWKPLEVPTGLNYSSLIFKIKGEKHSNSKVKTLVPLTPEQLAERTKIEDLVSLVVTENRVKQAIDETKAESQRDTGNVIRWIFNDIIKEEYDTMQTNNIDKKDIGKVVSNKAKNIFFNLIGI